MLDSLNELGTTSNKSTLIQRRNSPEIKECLPAKTQLFAPSPFPIEMVVQGRVLGLERRESEKRTIGSLLPKLPV